MKSGKSDLCRGHTLRLVELETQSRSGFPFGTVGVCALALAFPELGAEPVTGRIPELQDFTCARHHDPKLSLELDVVRLAQRLDEAAAQLWRTLVGVAPKCAIEGGFQDIDQRAGSEKRPVLSADEENVGGIAGVVIHADEGQTQLRFIAADRGNVAVVDLAEVAFEVALDLAGQRQVLRHVGPFEVEPKTRGARLDVA